MSHLNIEIKAKCSDLEKVRKILLEAGAVFIGLDHQSDTYFNVRQGRLKLREGNIENNLIFYERPNQQGPKDSNVILYKTNDVAVLKEMLVRSDGILTIVQKSREIYYIENVKFHLDLVKGLGSFVEIEAINSGGIDKDKLTEQCEHFMELFGIRQTELISSSYSDMLLRRDSNDHPFAI